MRSTPVTAAASLALVAFLASAGCGLKGPLALPEKSERVIIRGPGETGGAAPSPATDPAATGDGASASPPVAAPVDKATLDKKTPREEERPPPPPLPGGSNPGSARGG